METLSGNVIVRASGIKGDKVVNTHGEDLGKIRETMIDIKEGKIAYAVLSVGGVLGLGDKLFAIPWDALRLDSINKCFVLNVNKSRLEEAQGFDKDHWPQMADSEWSQEIYNFFEHQPYGEKPEVRDDM